MGDAERVGQAGQSTYVPSYSLPRDPQVTVSPRESERSVARSEWVNSNISALSDLNEVVSYLHGFSEGARSASVAGSSLSSEEWYSFYEEASGYLSNIPATKQLAIGACWEALYPEDKRFITNTMIDLDRGSAFKAVSDTVQRNRSSQASWEHQILNLYNTPLPVGTSGPLGVFRAFTTDEGLSINCAAIPRDLIGGSLSVSRPPARSAVFSADQKIQKEDISLQKKIGKPSLPAREKIAEAIASGDLPTLQDGEKCDLDAIYSDVYLKSALKEEIVGLPSSADANVIRSEDF